MNPLRHLSMNAARPVVILGALSLLLSACLSGNRSDPPPRPVVKPGARGPVTLNLPTSKTTQQCYAELSRAGVRFSPLPDRDYGNGCVVIGAVELIDIQMPVSGLKAMRCPLASKFLGWVRHGVTPAAREILGSELVKIESMGTYVCRGIVGRGAAAAQQVSQHGLGNAVDISAFILADGRRITVLGGWNSRSAKEKEFLRVIHGSACRRFPMVLGPEYNDAHKDHFHFDMSGRGYCK